MTEWACEPCTERLVSPSGRSFGRSPLQELDIDAVRLYRKRTNKLVMTGWFEFGWYHEGFTASRPLRMRGFLLCKGCRDNRRKRDNKHESDN